MPVLEDKESIQSIEDGVMFYLTRMSGDDPCSEGWIINGYRLREGIHHKYGDVKTALLNLVNKGFVCIIDYGINDIRTKRYKFTECDYGVGHGHFLIYHSMNYDRYLYLRDIFSYTNSAI